MSFPALLKKLFTNNGAGDKLNPGLLPDTLSGVPVGTIISYAGTTAPDGFLICNGAQVAKTTYAELFSAIGNTWLPSGSTASDDTFYLPDLFERFLEGGGQKVSSQSADGVAVQKNVSSLPIGKYFSAGLPEIWGYVNFITSDSRSSPVAQHAGALEWGVVDKTGDSKNSNGDARYGYDLSFSAGRHNATYGASTTVQPAAAAVLFLIKY